VELNNENTYSTYGREVIADLWGVDPEVMEATTYMAIICETAAKMSGATVLDVCIQKFSPFGLTIAVILSESHLTIHCTPNAEGGSSYIAFNCLTCGSVCQPRKALDYMVEILKPTTVYKQYIERGIR
jgi:S-adenosylmethionine decarboxylase